MPQVPVYQRTEQLRPEYRQGIDVQANGDDFGAGIGRAVQDVGQGLGNAAQAFALVQGKEHEATAKQADNELANWDRARKYDPNSGFLMTQGEAAVNGQTSYQEDFTKKRQEIGEKLSPDARRMFDEAADSRQQSSFQQAIIHAGKERKTWFENASKSRQDMFANEALTEFKDPDRVNRHIASGILEIQSQAADQGWAPETVKAQSEIYESNVRRNVILRMAEDDPLAAQAELDRTKGRLSGADQHDLDKALKVGVAEANAKVEAARITQKVTGSQNNATRFAAADLPRPAYSLLGVISGTESPGYNIINGGQKFSSYDDHPRTLGAGGSSTAAGKYQFVQGTWDRVAGALGLPNFSPENQDKGAWWLAQADYKSRTGRDLVSDINEGNYSQVRAGLASTWEGIAKLTDAQFSARMMSADRGGVAIDPEAMNAEINSIQDPDMRERVRRQMSGQIAQQQADYKTYSDTIGLKVLQHQITSEADILDDPVLSVGDKETHLRAWRTEQEKTGILSDSVAAFASGSFHPDPYDDKGRDATDKLFAAVASTVPADKVLPMSEEIIKQSGIVPKQMMSAVRQGLESQNVQEVLEAAQQASRISQISPPALGRRDGGNEVQRKTDDFNYMVNTLNLKPEEAAQKIADQNDPEKQRQRKVLEPAAKEFKKVVDGQDIGSLFDDSVIPFNDPQVGFTEGQALGIKADYAAIAEEQFYLANGNSELAMNRAKQEMQRLYGVTEITGSKVVMKHPPERYWPAAKPSTFAETVSGNPYGWVDKQLSDDLIALDPNVPKASPASRLPPGRSGMAAAPAEAPRVDMSKIQFVTTPETDRMVKRGEMPAYQVMYTDENGVLQTIPGKLWRPDASRINEKNSAMDKSEQDQTMKRARELQADERKRAQMQNSEDAGREANLDSFLDGPSKTAIDEVKP